MTETPLRELRVFPSTSSEHRLCHSFQDKPIVLTPYLTERLPKINLDAIALEGCARSSICLRNLYNHALLN